MIRGAGASISGKNYEKELHKNLKQCMLNGKPFNTQNENTSTPVSSYSGM